MDIDNEEAERRFVNRWTYGIIGTAMVLAVIGTIYVMPKIHKKMNSHIEHSSSEKMYQQYVKLRKEAPPGIKRTYITASEALVSIPYRHRGWETAKIILSLPNESKRRGEVTTLAKTSFTTSDKETSVRFYYTDTLGHVSLRVPYSHIEPAYTQGGKVVLPSRSFKFTISHYQFIVEGNCLGKIIDIDNDTEFPFDQGLGKFYKEEYFNEKGEAIKTL